MLHSAVDGADIRTEAIGAADISAAATEDGGTESAMNHISIALTFHT